MIGYFYHAVATKHPEGRVLMMDKISWKDGWPVVATDSPSLNRKTCIVINKYIKI